MNQQRKTKSLKFKTSFNAYCRNQYKNYADNCVNKKLGEPVTYNEYYLKLKVELKQGYKALIKEL